MFQEFEEQSFKKLAETDSKKNSLTTWNRLGGRLLWLPSTLSDLRCCLVSSGRRILEGPSSCHVETSPAFAGKAEIQRIPRPYFELNQAPVPCEDTGQLGSASGVSVAWSIIATCAEEILGQVALLQLWDEKRPNNIHVYIDNMFFSQEKRMKYNASYVKI